MKNIFTLFAVTFLFAIIFSSCKKQTITNTIYIKDTTVHNNTTINDTVHNASSIIGFWPGNYSSPGNYPTSQFSFLFRTNGTVRFYIDGVDTTTAGAKAEGVYRIIGYSVTTQFVVGGNQYSTLGTVDSNFIFYEGTLGMGLQTSGYLINIAHKQ
jgi:hypothetical protein